MYPELITRPDIKIFLPPIGGLTIYIWGDPDTIPDEDIVSRDAMYDICVQRCHLIIPFFL